MVAPGHPPPAQQKAQEMGKNVLKLVKQKQIFCQGRDGHIENLKARRQQKEFGRGTLKNELLLRLKLENPGSPSNTEVLLSESA